MNASGPKTPKPLPPGKTDLASDLLDDPEFADLMGPPVTPAEIAEAAEAEEEDDDP